MTATLTKQEIPSPAVPDAGHSAHQERDAGEWWTWRQTYLCPGLKSTIIDVPISE